MAGLPDLSRAEVEPLILPTFKSLIADEVKAREKSFEFLDFLVGRSGLLQEKDVGRYNFPHRTFQEYLTALWLVSRGDWLEECFAHRDDSDLARSDLAHGGASGRDAAGPGRAGFHLQTD